MPARSIVIARTWRLERVPDSGWLEVHTVSRTETTRHFLVLEKSLRRNPKIYELSHEDGLYFVSKYQDEAEKGVVEQWLYEDLIELTEAITRYDYSLNLDGMEATLTIYGGGARGLILLRTRWEVEFEVDERWSDDTVMNVLADLYPHIHAFQPAGSAFGRFQELSAEEIARYTDRSLATDSGCTVVLPKPIWEVQDEEDRRKRLEEAEKARRREIEERKRTTSCPECRQDPNCLCYSHDYGAC